MRILPVVIAALVASWAAAARAQPLTGPYVGFEAGSASLSGEAPRPSGGGVPARAAPEPGPGPAEVGSAGIGLGNGFRVEVEGMHQAGSGTVRRNGP